MSRQVKKDVVVETRELLEGLFERLQVTGEIEITPNKDKDEPGVEVVVKNSDSSGLLIGAHGSTLAAIQSFLTMALKQKTGEWIRVSVDIDGWRDKQEDYLRDLARQAAERVRSTGEEQNLYNLGPSQRRVVHVALSEEEGVVTESQGEGEGRYLVVKSSK